MFLVQCEFCCAEVIYFRKETPGNGTVFVVVERITENLCSRYVVFLFSKKNRYSTPFTTNFAKIKVRENFQYSDFLI